MNNKNVPINYVQCNINIYIYIYKLLGVTRGPNGFDSIYNFHNKLSWFTVSENLLLEF